MTHRELSKRIEEDIPFTIHVTDGRSIDVPHEDFIHLPGRGTVVFVTEYPEDPEEDSFTHIIALLMISGITKKIDDGSAIVREEG